MTSRALIACRSSPRTRGSSRAAKQSGGKLLGTGGAKMGNVHLKWAFSEAAVLFLRHTKDGKQILAGIEKKHGKGKALVGAHPHIGMETCAGNEDSTEGERDRPSIQRHRFDF